ncbi:MAG TPA: APC family permease, partial [Kofleriaceae bacterium]|nr:APC family permease [Kofleriaceae bacterium]
MSKSQERAPSSRIGGHAAWAMAVGGMIGGGVWTLSGVIFGAAGSLAPVALVLGGLVALATVHSYARLVAATKSELVPVAVVDLAGHRRIARVLAWLLVAVYVLATAVYTFTFGHYFAHAFGLGSTTVLVAQACAVVIGVVLNLRGAQESAKAQIIAVWMQLAILLGIALLGFVYWEPANLSRGVPAPSLGGIIVAMSGTFIAFEGFEMLAYDVRELRRPRNVLRAKLPLAVLAVAIIYALVSVGAASLVGAGALVGHEENALAVAGEAAAGRIGLYVVSLAACASAISAINATLFSVSRLARTSAEHTLLPDWCRRCNRHDAPLWAIVAISVGAFVVASVTDLTTLLAIAS